MIRAIIVCALMMSAVFKSDDQKRQEAAAKSGVACSACSGTGTIGNGGRGSVSSSVCKQCNGSGIYKR